MVVAIEEGANKRQHEDGGDIGAYDASHPQEKKQAVSQNGKGTTEAVVSSTKADDEVKEVHIVNEIEFKLGASLEGHERSVSYLAFSPDGKQLASCSADKNVIIWNPHEGNLVRRLNSDSAGELGGHERGISCIAWSPDSSLLCTASDDQTLRLWKVETGECIRVLRGHTHFVVCCDFSCRGNILVSGSMDETVRLWEVKTGEMLKEVPAHSDPVTSVKFSPDSSMFVSSSYDGLCRVWDTETGKCLQTVYIANNTPATSAMFTPNGHFLLINHLDSAIRLWDMQRAKWVKKYEGHRNEKFSILSDIWNHRKGSSTGTGGNDDRQHDPCVASGSEDNSIYLWNVSSQAPVCRIKGRKAGETEPADVHSDVILAVRCNPKYPMFASGAMDADRSVRVWIPAEP